VTYCEVNLHCSCLASHSNLYHGDDYDGSNPQLGIVLHIVTKHFDVSVYRCNVLNIGTYFQTLLTM